MGPRTYRKGYYFFSPQSSTDGGYNNITNMNKVSPTQNTPALQANSNDNFLSFQGPTGLLAVQLLSCFYNIK